MPRSPWRPQRHPQQPAVRESRPGQATLQVSRATAGFLERGHPWVRPDRFTKGLDRLRSGDVVTLVDERGSGLASALADPAAEICARVFHRLPGKTFDAAAAVRRAWDRRAALHSDATTTCYRVVHGEADFLPGLRVERYGDVLVTVLFADCLLPHVTAVANTLHELMPAAQIIIRDHRADLRVEETSAWGWSPDGRRLTLDPSGEVAACELGVPVTVRPFDGLATGIYVDQRQTRAWLRERGHSRRVLNLFAYTGMFSISLLHAGAAMAVDSDLSSASLAIASAHAARIEAADRHRAIAGDCRATLDRLYAAKELFDLVIIDPPTAALGGAGGGWVLRRDYPEVLAAAWRVTAPEGLLIACCNTLHGKAFDLKAATKVAAPDGQLVDGPGYGADLPQLSGFPEGRPFQLVAVRR